MASERTFLQAQVSRVSRALVGQRRAGASLAVERVPTYPFSLACASLTCALTPAYTVRWHIGWYPTTLLEASIVVTVAVFALETLRQRTAMEWRTPFTIPALLFVLAGTIAVVVAPDRRAALGLYRAYLIEPIAFFFVVAAVARSARRAYLILAGLGLAGLIVAIANSAVVIDAIRRHTLDLALPPPVVIYMTSNAVALFLVPLIAIAASLVLYGEDLRWRLISAAFLAIGIVATLLSFSRGGYVALAAIALGLALTHRRRVWLVAATAVAGLLLSRVPLIQSRIAHELNFADPYNSIAGRLPLWRSTLRMLRDHPVFGGGLSGFAKSVAPYWTGEYAGKGLIYPHNLLLNFWTETGLLGVVAFVWILIQGFIVSWRGWRWADPAWRPVCLGVLLALVGMVVHGLVDVPYWKNDLSLEFWTLLGVTWAGTRWGTLKGASPPVVGDGEPCY